MKRGSTALRLAGVLVFALLAWGRLAGQAAATDPTDPHDPYRLTVVQAACGDEGGSPPQAVVSSSGGHSGESPLEPGMARVYVITETRGAFFGLRGAPVRLGMDGKWFGANGASIYEYSALDVRPGVHHLCAAASVKEILPHTSAAVLLARVDAKAGQSYFFYNFCLKGLRIFTLSPINGDDGAMYLQALPSMKVPKLSKTTAAQAACGADPDHMPHGPASPQVLPGPPAAGQAMVYFFSGVPEFSGSDLVSMPIHVGMDGRWIGKTQRRSYLAVLVAPGVHRLCSAAFAFPGSGVYLDRLDAVAGKTYFIEAATLQPVEDSLAVKWLQRIAAMPKSDAPDLHALKKWMGGNSPAWQTILSECGTLAPGSSAPAASLAEPVVGKPPARQLFFVLNAPVNQIAFAPTALSLDDRWLASLQRPSWVSFPLSEGPHRVCLSYRFKTFRWGRQMTLPAFFAVDAAEDSNIYFESSDYTEIAGHRDRLDPDEGELLVASYPNAATLHP